MTELVSLKDHKIKKSFEPEAVDPGKAQGFPPIDLDDTNIITVSSNKGGVGKTSVALTAAIYYSIIKKQATLLLELDSSPGDFSSLFDIDPGKNLEMAIRFPEHFHRYTKRIGNNLDALGGIASPVTAEEIKRKDFYDLLAVLAGKYKNIIIDTQTVLNGLIIDAFLLSDMIMLITDYALESISRIAVLHGILTGQLSIARDKVELVINKKGKFDFLKIWDYTKIAGIPLSGFISFDKKFSKTFFLTNYKRVFKTRFYRQFKRLVEDGIKKQVS